MQSDRQRIIVHAPKLLEQHLGLAARVDEHERGLVGLDQLIDFTQRMARGVAGPGQPFLRIQHFDDRRRGAASDDDIG